MAIARVFLDTSALFAGIWSPTGGARRILELGEAGVVSLLVSAQVLGEIESVVRRKAPSELGALAMILDCCGVAPSPDPSHRELSFARAICRHAGDARILAAAIATRPDYFVTLDREHFLDDQAVRAGAPFPIGTPGDFLAWLRQRFPGL